MEKIGNILLGVRRKIVSSDIPNKFSLLEKMDTTRFVSKRDEIVVDIINKSGNGILLEARACVLFKSLVEEINSATRHSEQNLVIFDDELDEEHIEWIVWHELTHICISGSLVALLWLQREAQAMEYGLTVGSKDWYDKYVHDNKFHDGDAEEMVANAIANTMVRKSYERKNINYGKGGNMKNKTIYIAGKITGDDNYKEKFKNLQERLEANGNTVLNPATLPKGMSNAQYMRICFAMIDSADSALFMSDAGNSDGAMIEMSYCMYTSKPYELMCDI